MTPPGLARRLPLASGFLTQNGGDLLVRYAINIGRSRMYDVTVDEVTTTVIDAGIGTYIMNGGTLHKYDNGGDIGIGIYANSVGLMELHNGASFTQDYNWAQVGYGYTASGAMTLDGASSYANNILGGGGFTVGREGGTGLLSVTQGSSFSTGELRVGEYNNGSGTLTIDSSVVNVAENAFIGHQYGNGVMTLTASATGGATMNAYGFQLGNSENVNTSTGVATLTGYDATHKAVLNITQGWDCRVGCWTGGSGTLTMNAYSELNTLGGWLQVGEYYSSGLLTMAADSKVTAAAIRLGGNGGSGTMTTAGDVTSLWILRVGDNGYEAGGSGNLNIIDNGRVVVNGNTGWAHALVVKPGSTLTLGNADHSDNPTFSMVSDCQWWNGWSHLNGAVTVNSGTYDLRFSCLGTEVYDIVGSGTTGSFKVTGGQVLTNREFNLGSNSASSGSLTLTGGVFQALEITPYHRDGAANDGSSGYININGGELRAAADNPLFVNPRGATTFKVTVGANGAKINSSIYSIGIDVPLKSEGGDAGLTKLGTGTLTLGGTNTYEGATNILAGTLAFTATNPFSVYGVPQITVWEGATVAAGVSGGIARYIDLMDSDITFKNNSGLSVGFSFDGSSVRIGRLDINTLIADDAAPVTTAISLNGAPLLSLLGLTPGVPTPKTVLTYMGMGTTVPTFVSKVDAIGEYDLAAADDLGGNVTLNITNMAGGRGWVGGTTWAGSTWQGDAPSVTQPAWFTDSVTHTGATVQLADAVTVPSMLINCAGGFSITDAGTITLQPAAGADAQIQVLARGGTASATVNSIEPSIVLGSANTLIAVAGATPALGTVTASSGAELTLSGAISDDSNAYGLTVGGISYYLASGTDTASGITGGVVKLTNTGSSYTGPVTVLNGATLETVYVTPGVITVDHSTLNYTGSASVARTLGTDLLLNYGSIGVSAATEVQLDSLAASTSLIGNLSVSNGGTLSFTGASDAIVTGQADCVNGCGYGIALGAGAGNVGTLNVGNVTLYTGYMQSVNGSANVNLSGTAYLHTKGDWTDLGHGGSLNLTMTDSARFFVRHTNFGTGGSANIDMSGSSKIYSEGGEIRIANGAANGTLTMADSSSIVTGGGVVVGNWEGNKNLTMTMTGTSHIGTNYFVFGNNGEGDSGAGTSYGTLTMGLTSTDAPSIAASGWINIGVWGRSDITVNMNGSSSITNSGANDISFAYGNYPSVVAVNMNDNAVIHTGQDMYLACYGGSTATVVMTGHSVIAADRGVAFGAAGSSATFTLSDYAGIHIGTGCDSSRGSYALSDNAQLTVGGDLNVGDQNTNCSVLVYDNAMVSVGGNFRIGIWGGVAGTSNHVIIDGGATGTASFHAGSMDVGRQWGSDPVTQLGDQYVTIQGPGATATIGGVLKLGASSGSGVWNQDGGVTSVGGTVILGQYDIDYPGNGSVCGYGVLNLRAGTFSAPRFSTDSSPADGLGDAARGTVNFNGGLLVANSSRQDNFFATTGLDAAVTLNVQAGGMKIQNNDYVGITQVLNHDATGTDGGLTKTGGHILLLTGANTYDGPTVVKSGWLQVTDGVGLPTASNLTLDGGGWMCASTGGGTLSRSIGTGAGQIQIGLGGATLANGGNATVGGNGTLVIRLGDTMEWGDAVAENVGRTWIGNLNLGAGYWEQNSVIDFQSNINLNGDRTILYYADAGRGDSLILSGVIANGTASTNSSLTVASSEVMHMTGQNTYTGTTYMNGGYLMLGCTTGAAVQGDVQLNGGFLLTSQPNQFGPTSKIVVPDGRYVEFSLMSNDQTVAGLDIPISSAYIEPSHGSVGGGTGNATLTVNVASGSNSVCGAIIRDRVDDANLLTITKTGAGTLTLISNYAGINTYAGGTNVLGGTLVAADVNRLGTGPVVIDGGTLSMACNGVWPEGYSLAGQPLIDSQNVASFTLENGALTGPACIRSLTGYTVKNGSISAPLTDAVNIDGNPYSGTYLGNISVGVTKTGSGTVVLSGANAYTGKTILEAGTLQLATAAQSVVLTGGGVDLQHGVLALIYTDTTPAAEVDAALKASYDGGLWDIGQFQSTTAALDGLTLGWIDDAAGNVIITRTVAGDFNLDGAVDLADLDIWMANAGAGDIWALGDANYDSAVDLADLDVWMANAGQSTVIGESLSVAAGGHGVVPEPGTFALLLPLLGLVGYVVARRRSK